MQSSNEYKRKKNRYNIFLLYINIFLGVLSLIIFTYGIISGNNKYNNYMFNFNITLFMCVTMFSVFQCYINANKLLNKDMIKEYKIFHTFSYLLLLEEVSTVIMVSAIQIQ